MSNKPRTLSTSSVQKCSKTKLRKFCIVSKTVVVEQPCDDETEEQPFEVEPEDQPCEDEPEQQTDDCETEEEPPQDENTDDEEPEEELKSTPATDDCYEQYEKLGTCIYECLMSKVKERASKQKTASVQTEEKFYNYNEDD